MEHIFIAIGVILLIFIIWYIAVLNKLNRTIIKIEEALSGIDIALTKRYDVITKMVEVVKGYTKHEKEILFKIIKMRENLSLIEKSSLNKAMDENMQKVNIVVEKYPDLKANENFKELQKAIVDVEEHLQASRRCYNANVSIYNQLIVSFPINLVAKNKKMTKKDFFEIEESKKENVKIKSVPRSSFIFSRYCSGKFIYFSRFYIIKFLSY